MIKIENTEVVGWEAALRGMRNPLNSWDKSDSLFEIKLDDNPESFNQEKHWGRGITGLGYWAPREWANDYHHIGPNDQNLMKRLRNAGTDHRKFMRMLTVYVDITAPLYWWKEFDTYKVGTVANSCSTMHKIYSTPITLDDFSFDDFNDPEYGDAVYHLEYYDDPDKPNAEYNHTHFEIMREIVVEYCEMLRMMYLYTKNKQYWRMLIQLLPNGYMQKRTVMLNYEVLANMYKSRKDHKLSEWHELCDWMRDLPYSELITGEFKE